MTQEEMLKNFYTMHFGDGTVKECIKLNEYSLYLIMCDGPDLVFCFENINNWGLWTAGEVIKRYILKRKDDDQ